MNSEPLQSKSLQQDLLLTASPMDDAQALLTLLDEWAELGWLRALDVSLTRFLAREAIWSGEPASPILLLAIALTSHQLGRGHVCLDLEMMTADDPDALLSLPPENAEAPETARLPSELLRGLTRGNWSRALDHRLLVAHGEIVNPDITKNPATDDPLMLESTPLVRNGLRLYLRRYWRYEQSIARDIRQRLQTETLPAMDSSAVTALREALQALFGSEPSDDTDWQRVACANAARSEFSVITGGPGTGKTTTVVRLLAALQHVAMTTAPSESEPSSEQSAENSLLIRLAAPTGKAAARLNESLAGAVDGLPLKAFDHPESLRQAIPTQVTTLHRLLGSLPGSRNFRHHRNNPLLVDILVIDEASMVDVEMMARVLDALPQGARLILLGDKDQLASVDAGAVLGDLCARAAEGRYTPDTRQWLQAVSGCPIDTALVNQQGDPLDQAITLLRKSYRFDRHSGIGQLAAAVNQTSGDPELSAIDVFRGGYGDIAKVRLAHQTGMAQISQHCVYGGADVFIHSGEGRQVNGKPLPAPVGYGYYLETMHAGQPGADSGAQAVDDWAGQVLRAHGQFQVLCALRRGRYGVEKLNSLIARALQNAGLITASLGWYAGRPVLVTANDYSLGLMNGDIGIALNVPFSPAHDNPQEQGEPRWLLRVAFPANDGSGQVKWVMPSRLSNVETVYAMTVHKAQGSEFNHACLILPDRRNPILTRELIYTGITRAKNWFSLLLAHDDVFTEASATSVTRSSGLRRAIVSRLANS